MLSDITGGTPQLKEHVDLKWITGGEIPNFEFCPADKDIIKILAEEDYLD